MDQETFQLFAAIASVVFTTLLAVIGYLGARTINGFKERQDSHSGRMDGFDIELNTQKGMIETNAANIKANGDKDSIHRDYMEKQFSTLQGHVSSVEADVKEGNALLNQLLGELKVSNLNRKTSD